LLGAFCPIRRIRDVEAVGRVPDLTVHAGQHEDPRALFGPVDGGLDRLARLHDDRVALELARGEVTFVVAGRRRRRRGRRLAPVRIERTDGIRIRWQLVLECLSRSEIEGVEGALGPARLRPETDLRDVVVPLPVRVQQLDTEERLLVRDVAAQVEIAVGIDQSVADVPAVGVPGIAAARRIEVAELTRGIVAGGRGRSVARLPVLQDRRAGARLRGHEDESHAEREGERRTTNSGRPVLQDL
jgi:hypothetical protein